MGSNESSWHACSAEATLRHWAVDPQRGLTEAEACRRREVHGSNAMPEPPPVPRWRRLARQFASPLVGILGVAAVLAAALGHRADAAVILVVVLANAAIGLLHEGRAERSMAALRRLTAVQVRVRRDGAERLVPAAELVPGDLVRLAAGDAVVADARVVEAAGLQLMEAALTGESVPVAKGVEALARDTVLADRAAMVHSGTEVAAGRGVAVVVATGAASELGRIAHLAAAAQEPRTPLEDRLARFGRGLLAGALALFVAVLVLGLWRGIALAELLMVAISQMVSIVPEGLPVAMTIALAVGMQRMAARGAIIRRLAAVETLGSTTVICSDKTGTLTANAMTAVALWLPDGRTARVAGSGYAPRGGITIDGEPAPLADPALQALIEAGVACNDARLVPAAGADAGWTVLGDPTEGALLTLAAKAGVEPEAWRAACPRRAELPFDADAQLMATTQAGAPGRAWTAVKGSPEAVLQLLAEQASAPAARVAADAMAADALRVLAFGRVAGDGDLAGGFDALRGRVELLGLVGEIDPPRESARAAVARCQGAGIRPLMITGDHPRTGLAIARELGIAREGETAIDGGRLERMSDAELDAALAHAAVFARVQPAQKLRIVQALQARGEVVAMTGDGVNDAPALARADVGVAMGRSGTEVAKAAAKIVITDDDFATVVGAVEQGRVVYANLKKVILYLFATSLDEVVVLLAALAAGLPMPLAAVQILWVNIVTEGTLTVNLVMDPPDGDEMRRAPVPRHDALLDRTALARLALMAATAAAITFGWFAWRIGAGVPVDAARTEAFVLTVVCQWFNLLNCRSAVRSAFSCAGAGNAWLWGGLALSVLLQCLVLWVPAFAAAFHVVPPAPATLAALVALAAGVLGVEEARKAMARRRQGKPRVTDVT